MDIQSKKRVKHHYFIFDAYGTLFKTSDFLPQLALLIGDKAGPVIAHWRRKQLEYTWLYNQMNKYCPFDEITTRALQTALEHHKISALGIEKLLFPMFSEPILFPDAYDTLNRLKQKGKKTAILSNGTLQMLMNGTEKTGVNACLDYIVSADEIKTYKPDPRVYALAMRRLSCKPEACLFISSNQWDVAGANAFGLEALWVNRDKESKEALPFGKMREVAELSAVADVP